LKDKGVFVGWKGDEIGIGFEFEFEFE